MFGERNVVDGRVRQRSREGRTLSREESTGRVQRVTETQLRSETEGRDLPLFVSVPRSKVRQPNPPTPVRFERGKGSWWIGLRSPILRGWTPVGQGPGLVLVPPSLRPFRLVRAPRHVGSHDAVRPDDPTRSLLSPSSPSPVHHNLSHSSVPPHLRDRRLPSDLQNSDSALVIGPWHSYTHSSTGECTTSELKVLHMPPLLVCIVSSFVDPVVGCGRRRFRLRSKSVSKQSSRLRMILRNTRSWQERRSPGLLSFYSS